MDINFTLTHAIYTFNRIYTWQYLTAEDEPNDFISYEYTFSFFL